MVKTTAYGLWDPTYHISKMAAKDDDLTSLWVDAICSFSSQYNTTGWSANCVVGEPKVYPQYGDIRGTWAQAICDANQFIEVSFAESLYIEKLELYETLNAGAVVKIEAQDEFQKWHLLWEKHGGPSRFISARIFSPPIEPTDLKTSRLNSLKIYVDCTACNSWCELDAIRLIGKRTITRGHEHSESLSNDLSTLVNNPSFSDVSFLIQDKTVFGHRAILSARSRYFEAMFTDGLKESLQSKEPIAIPNISHSGFIAVLQYLYTDALHGISDPAHYTELIRVADQFSLDGMRNLAHHHLSDDINDDNVIHVFRDASEKLPQLDDVRKTCMSYIASHMSTVSQSKAFCDLPQPLMLEIVQVAASKLQIK